MYGSDGDDETSSLLPRPGWSLRASKKKDDDEETPRRKKKPTKAQSGIMLNRIFIIVVLAVVVAVSVYYQFVINTLRTSLQQEHEHAQELDSQLQIHQSVIERFNSSVTNTDVLDRLTSLEHDLKSTKTKLQDDLAQTKNDIKDQLDETLTELSETVTSAKAEIQSEVEMVKKDVEQYVITTQDQFSMENSFMVYQLAGTLTLLSCLISMWHMTAHLRKLNQPEIQRKILAILWMSPIYAVTSWFSLVFHSAEGYLSIIKDAYEAYIIYQFLSFCIAVLGKGDREAVVDLLALRADHLTPPFRLFGCFEICCGCCKPEPYESNRALADDILLQCQFFAMQFVFFRPVTTTAIVVLRQLDYYGAGDGPTDYRSPQFYITIVQNVSIFTAFAGLLKFYHAVDKDLAWCRPFAKFLCIKGVVFMTFWQGLAISILAEFTDVGGQDAQEWAMSAQNFLICLEMLLFSIAHFYCFPTEEWEEDYRVKHSQGQFGDSIALNDFFQDVRLILKSNKGGKKKKPMEPTITEGDEESETTEATSRDIFDEEKMVAEALEESLGLAGDDPDIVEAKKRLLESKVLSPEFFEGSMSPGEYSDDLISYDEKSDASEEDDDSQKYEGQESYSAGSGDENDERDVEGGVNGDDRGRNTSLSEVDESFDTAAQQVPTERTSLVSQDNGSPLALRPSIWTSVASFAELERTRSMDEEEGTKPNENTGRIGESQHSM